MAKPKDESEPKRKASRQRSDAEVIKALRDCHGMVTYAARKLGMTRHGVYYRLRTNSKIAEAREEALQCQLDRTEIKLFEAIEKGEAWAIAFCLKCRGKERGYVETSRVSLDASELVVRVVYDGDG